MLVKRLEGNCYKKPLITGRGASPHPAFLESLNSKQGRKSIYIKRG